MFARRPRTRCSLALVVLRPGVEDRGFTALSKIWNVAILFEWYAVRDLAQRECFVGFPWKCPVLSKDKTVTQVVQYGCSGWSLRLY